MDFWFSEKHTKDVKLSIRVDKQVYSGKSDLQRIDIFDTPAFGRMLVLDGYLMLTEKDEFIYHEMMTHIPMAVHPHVRDVLVIGAGDGGVVRELTRYPDIERIDLAEIDELVIEVSKQYLPFTACKLEDPRVHIFIDDGVKFVRRKKEEYDLIIVDSTDPFGPTEGLFTKEFYGSCFKALNDTGVMVYQHGSPFYAEDEEECRKMHQKVFRCFPVSKVYQAHIPTYPSGHWLFGFASKKYHPLTDFDPERWNKRGIRTWYYTTNLHTGAFMLPKYVEDLLEEEEDKI